MNICHRYKHKQPKTTLKTEKTEKTCLKSMTSDRLVVLNFNSQDIHRIFDDSVGLIANDEKLVVFMHKIT